MINTAIATSRRGYLSQTELAQYANITINETSEADDIISQAEEMIDGFVGYQAKFLDQIISGLAASGTTSTIMLESVHQNTYDNDYFKLCQIEIVGGNGTGQIRKISSSTKAGLVTVAENWTTAPDSTSFYQITQLGKFPRHKDVMSHDANSVVTFYKSIPEAVRRATAAQVEYIINMGAGFFGNDQSDKQSEAIGDYSYTIGASGSSGFSRLMSPKARLLLRGYINRKGMVLA